MKLRAPSRVASAPQPALRSVGIRRHQLAGRVSDDPLELEADHVAGQVLGGSPAFIGGATATILPLARAPAPRAHGAPPSVQRALRETGTPLAPALRRDMEHRFNQDFSQVRVHLGASADRAAREIGADAYTIGTDMAFRRGRFDPQTHAGRQLLAHELTHVVQQAAGRVEYGQVQNKAGDSKPAAVVSRPFKLRVDHALDPEQLHHEFVKQYYGYSSEAQIQGKLSLWSVPTRSVTPAEAAAGYVTIMVSTQDEDEFERLDPQRKEGVNKETDRRFWESTGYKPGQKLGSSPKDREIARVWMGTRNAVVTEDRQRKQIDALPDDIKQVLFAGDADAATLTPDQYTQALRIAAKLATLPAALRKDYLDRINAATTSLDVLENSVEAYLRLREERTGQAVKAETAAKPLLGAETLYDRYRFYQTHLKNVALGADATPQEIELATQIQQDYRDGLLAELKVKGFDSIEAFAAALEAYRLAFREQAVSLALDVLAHYDHMLFEERTKLARPGAAAALSKGIADSGAAANYKQYHEHKAMAFNLRMAHEPKETWWIKPAAEAERAATAAKARAEADVIRGAGGHSLIAEPGIDREKLAGLDAGATEAYLLGELAKRENDVRTARQELKEDPERVFKQPDLIKATLQIQGAGADTVYGKLIADHIEDQKNAHLLSAIALGILALALTLLVPVGGAVAAAALIVNAGISTYQAYKAYTEYEEQERDYRLHFLSSEPSLFWVGLAIAAAAFDLGMASTALIKGSASALKTLEPSLMAFSKDGDLVTLAAKIDAAEGLQKATREALKREAAAALAGEQALRELGGKMYSVVPGMIDPGVVKPLFRALYYTVRRGINTLVKLRSDAKFVKAIGELTQLSGASRAELAAAFEEVKELVRIGQAKGMDEAALLGYVDRWAINRGNPGFGAKLLDEMNVWRPLTAEQQSTLNALKAQKQVVTSLYEQKAAALEELAALRAQANKTAEDLKEIRSLEDELTKLDPSLLPQKSPSKLGPGSIAEAEAALARREAEAAKAELTLYDRMRTATPSDAARERALKGVVVDQVGPLKTTPGPLEVDHIVSVREISDMEGFDKLLSKDQKAIIDMKDNLVPMDSAANRSKGERSWRAWDQARNFYSSPTIDAMIKREAEVRNLIRAAIKDHLAKLGGAKP